MPAIHNKNPEDREFANWKTYIRDSHTKREVVNLENLYKLRDAFYEIHYKDKLYVGWLYPEQKLISNQIIKEFIYWHQWFTADDIFINVSRQFGKSFIVFSMIVFLLIFMPSIVRKKVTVWITVNKKDQVKKNFTEVRRYLEEIIPYYNIEFYENTKDSLELSNWSKIVIFSMEANHNEWETLDLSIVDEAQDLRDEKYQKEIAPMMSRTWWISIFLWVWWYKANDYMFKLNNPETKNIFKYDCYSLLETCKKSYEETWDERHLLYLNAIKKAKKDMNEIEFSTQWELKWAVEVWNFIKLENLQQLRWDYESIEDYDTPVYIWIDWAKIWDRTVVTVVWKIDWKIKILNWFKIPTIWMKYNQQIKEIYRFIAKYNVQKIFTDTTWVWNAVVDFLELKYYDSIVERIDFSEKRKDIMWTNLDSILSWWLFEYPSLENKRTKEFETEFWALEKEYKKNWRLSYHHPEKGWFHDDYVDSLALALLFTQETQWEWVQLF